MCFSASFLFDLVRKSFQKVKDPRKGDVNIALIDMLMSAFAMFSLKDSSLHAFDQRRKNEREVANLEQIYGIEDVPSDTRMRTVLDEVSPEEISPIFKDIVTRLQEGQVLKEMKFLGSYYLLSIDGTTYFSSKKIDCANCLQRRNSKTGEITYHHQMLMAAIVHPSFSEVIPIAPEPIIKQDGENKNDCESNASKRFFNKFRQEYPNLPIIVLQDALYANAPHIRELNRHNLRYIIRVKKDDHKFLFDKAKESLDKGRTTIIEETKEEIKYRYQFSNGLPLNKSNQNVLVNLVEYEEATNDETHYFSWITDIKVVKENVKLIEQGGRSRWKIENETINTMKNHGYNFGHNFGHGHNHLSVLLIFLMLLAFLVDQVQQLACHLWKKVKKKEKTKKKMWESIRNLFYALSFNSMEQIYEAIFYGYKIVGFEILYDTG